MELATMVDTRKMVSNIKREKGCKSVFDKEMIVSRSTNGAGSNFTKTYHERSFFGTYGSAITPAC
jgi:aspartyl aminopeptidase